MFEKLNDLELINEYKKEESPPSIYWIALGSTVIALLNKFLPVAFWITIIILIIMLVRVILISILEKQTIDKRDLLKKEILIRLKNKGE